MTEFLNKLQNQLSTGLPFAVYCKPGSNIVKGVFQKDEAVSAPDFSEPGFVFAPFAKGETVFIPAKSAEVITAVSEPEGNSSAEAPQPEIDTRAKKDFEAFVAHSVAAIKQGKFGKLVCSRNEKVTVEDLDVVAVFRKMLAAYPNAFRYCFYHPEAGLWMGATPEQLLKAEGTTIQTVALAGTQLYKEGEEAVWPDKERQEQLFVTDYIVDELRPYAANVQATKPYTFRAGNIVHIKTDIKAQLKASASIKDVVDALHPTPAVCGLPKAEAMQFLIKHEGYDREYYSGFLGEVNMEGKTDLFVNLRCMKVEDNTAQLFIGCGITKDSDPEKEFIETVNKGMTMRRVL
jgi:isochorismate synthase